jgi:hypothetical protein
MVVPLELERVHSGCGSDCPLSLPPFDSEQPSLEVISFFPLLHKMPKKASLGAVSK